MMRKVMGMVVVAALAVAGAGCSSSSDTGPVHGARPRGEVAEVQGTRVSVRLRGDATDGFQAVLVPVLDVRVQAGGRELPVDLDAVTANLARADHATEVAHFMLPDGVEDVQVHVQLDDFGGYERGADRGVLDTRVAPLTFTSQAAWLREKGHAVVHVDLARSVRRVSTGRAMLLPAGDVRH